MSFHAAMGDGPKLRFLVTDATREICRVELPPAAVDNLEDLFPDEDRAAVVAAGLDLAAIRRRAQSSGYAPQSLIEAAAGARRYRIWIE